MAIRDVRNTDIAGAFPVSDWQVNLKDKDIQPAVIDAIRRQHEVTQQLQSQVRELKATQPVPAPDPGQSVLATFVELNIGSPGTGGSGAVRFRVGRGSPEGVLEGSAQREIYFQLDSAAGSFCWTKNTGEGKVGWKDNF